MPILCECGVPYQPRYSFFQIPRYPMLLRVKYSLLGTHGPILYKSQSDGFENHLFVGAVYRTVVRDAAQKYENPSLC